MSIILGIIAEKFEDDLSIYLFLLLVPVVSTSVQNYFFISWPEVDSPQWLLSDKRISQVEYLFKKIYKPWAWQYRLTLLEQEQSKKKPQTKLSSKILKKPLILCSILCVLQQFSGVNGIIFYSDRILKDSESSSNQSSYFTLVIGLFNFLTVFPMFVLIKKIGRKVLLMQGLMGISILFAVFSSLYYFLSGLVNNWIKLLILLLVVWFYETSLGPVIWIYITEILSAGWVGIAITLQWICAGIIAGSYLFLFKFGYDQDIDIYFSISGLICFIGFFLVLILTVERKTVQISESMPNNWVNNPNSPNLIF
jgi:Sugar (and other) transporter